MTSFDFVQGSHMVVMSMSSAYAQLQTAKSMIKFTACQVDIIPHYHIRRFYFQIQLRSKTVVVIVVVVVVVFL